MFICHACILENVITKKTHLRIYTNSKKRKFESTIQRHINICITELFSALNMVLFAEKDEELRNEGYPNCTVKQLEGNVG